MRMVFLCENMRMNFQLLDSHLMAEIKMHY